ncbi:MAG TPA: glucoamylase family protein [Terracidiphilus sp.]|nr:glucoamylase family protein [Terracidiphilus sp.]
MTDSATIIDPLHSHNDELSEELLAAASKARSWDVAYRPVHAGSFHQRVLARRRELLKLEGQLASLPAPSPNLEPRMIGLHDLRANPRLLRSAITAATIKPADMLKLPRVLLPNRQEEPRILAVCELYLQAMRGDFSASTFTAFLRALQAHDPLTVFELWSIPSFLRFSLLEAMLAEAQAALHSPDAPGPSPLPGQFRSLRSIANSEWATLIEPLIAIDTWLSQDPAGAFPLMDFDTREIYRVKVAYLARHSDFTEMQVAKHALDLAAEGAQLTFNDPRMLRRVSHIGYYLIDKGFPQLASRVNFHPRILDRVRTMVRDNADDFYITGIQLITIFFIAAALFPLLANYPVFGRLAITFLLMLLPAMQCAVDLANNTITALFDPTPLPKLDFSKGIPDECTTLVAVPTLLLNEKQVRELITDLEVRFLANRDPNLHFVLLTDLPDSVSKPRVDDSNPLVDLATRLVDELNHRYASPQAGGFLFLHRHRIFNVRQGVWMGWERKRGKLLDLNKFLIGEYDAFPIKAGRLDLLSEVKYILTLDSDTQLPRGAAARMIGAIAHPLNKAIIDPKQRIVIEGYGILQPRIDVSVSSAARSRLAAIFSGQTGFDIYSRAASDAYQDLYGEGIFTGKGIYEVAALHAVLNKRFPSNALLSHDLIEGAYARAGLLSDIELIDDYPSHYSAYTRRKHRWVRGDWQIAQWMFSRVPDESGKRVPSPISTVSRWKIFDNLRRSLVEPLTFILFVAGWFYLPGGPVYWTVVPLILIFFPTFLQLVFSVGRALASGREGMVAQAFRYSGQAALAALLSLFFLPHQTLMAIDAIVRALIRRFITGERLLEWETAAEAESTNRKVTPVDRYLAMMPFIACGLAVLIYVFAPRRAAIFVAAPILVVWCLATIITAWLNKPPREENKRIGPADKHFLHGHALRIWRYFCEFGGERHNYLIPDNVQEKDHAEAPRVSPTNIGLLLNARQAACELGFLTSPEFVDLTRKSLATIERIEKLRGHIFNWYDTQTCSPLEANPFVSTVDSGNLVASLYTLRAGAAALLEKPLLSRQLFTGLRLHWEMMHAQGKFASPLAKLSPPGNSAPVSDWIAWLQSASAALDAAAEASSVYSGSQPEDLWWSWETRNRIHALLDLVRDCMPWLLPEYRPLREIPELEINLKSETLTIEAAAAFAEELELKLARPAAADPSGDSLAAAALRAALPGAARSLREYAAGVREIAERSGKLAEDTEFGFLVNPGRQVLSIGYDVRGQKVHEACYDMLASEARIATFLAVARGELPQQSWFKLARDYTYVYGIHAIISWTGTMFEYLMPSLWMRSYPHTLIAKSLAAAVYVQRAFARTLGIPWGISESGAARRNEAGDYHYHAWGIPQISLFYEATAGPVVSPYSTFLALGVDSVEAVSNLRYMASVGWVGPYGYYEAADYTTSSKNGELVREWMAHHQGMSLLAVANCLCDDVVQEWFHANPLVQSTELLLHEAPTSTADLKAMMRDLAGIPQKVGEPA